MIENLPLYIFFILNIFILFIVVILMDNLKNIYKVFIKKHNDYKKHSENKEYDKYINSF